MLPIDEMLSDLREALEVFDTDPTDERFAQIQCEIMHIEVECGTLLIEASA